MDLAKSIMVQGTSSHVGKSLLCTALCRIFAEDGFHTAPFKAQNMGLNSAICADGGEIGRAQAEQAEAAGVLPEVRMNPIFLKPQQDMQSQVLVMGKPLCTISAQDYRLQCIPVLKPVVQSCLQDLQQRFDILVIEGAGSPVEVNLKDRDIVNMSTAIMADSPVLLAADIDRGGVFAALIGTLELLEEHERQRVKGFVINKFRGDLELLRPGLEFLEQRTKIPVLGVIPYLHGHGIEQEDSVVLADMHNDGAKEAVIQIAVIQFPHIENFYDLRPFFHLPDTRLRMVKAGEKIGQADVLILPGSENPMLDLRYLREQDYDQEILALAEQGAYIAGIGGGYQMLGEVLEDPYKKGGKQSGLGLLPLYTCYTVRQFSHQVQADLCAGQGFWQSIAGEEINAYEIRNGQTQIGDHRSALLEIKKSSDMEANILDGAVSADGRIFGTHLHGFFHNISVLLAFINAVRIEKQLPLLKKEDLQDFQQRDQRFERLAGIVREALDMEKLYAIMDVQI